MEKYYQPSDEERELMKSRDPVQTESNNPPVHKVPFHRQDLVRNGIPGRSKKGQPRR